VNDSPPPPRLGFFSSPPHKCGYLPDRDATTLFADPRITLTTDTYRFLSERGFRRSGVHVYRPHCVGCSACIAVRVVVDEFSPRRKHRRTIAQNADIEVHRITPTYNDEHFRLYEKYLQWRHADSQTEATDPGAYMSFLTAAWCDTTFVEFRLAQELVAVAVVDQLGDALSSVYTFFSPDYPQRSLGRFAVLKQIEWARAAGLRWVYLGYWVSACKKMSYKNEYAPIEYFRDGDWHAAPDDDA
jgi:leucyl-tRNA---protein transferase